MSVNVDVTVAQSFEVFQQLGEIERYVDAQITAVNDTTGRAQARRQELQAQTRGLFATARDTVLSSKQQALGARLELEKQQFRTHAVQEQLGVSRVATSQAQQNMSTFASLLGDIDAKLTILKADVGASTQTTTDLTTANLAAHSATQKKVGDLLESQDAMTKAIEETLPTQLNATFKQMADLIVKSGSALTRTAPTSFLQTSPAMDGSALISSVRPSANVVPAAGTSDSSIPSVTSGIIPLNGPGSVPPPTTSSSDQSALTSNVQSAAVTASSNTSVNPTVQASTSPTVLDPTTASSLVSSASTSAVVIPLTSSSAAVSVPPTPASAVAVVQPAASATTSATTSATGVTVAISSTSSSPAASTDVSNYVPTPLPVVVPPVADVLTAPSLTNVSASPDPFATPL